MILIYFAVDRWCLKILISKIYHQGLTVLVHHGCESQTDKTTIISQKDHSFYLFDSHSRDEQGLSVPDGKSCLLKFSSINELGKYFQVCYLEFMFTMPSGIKERKCSGLFFTPLQNTFFIIKRKSWKIITVITGKGIIHKDLQAKTNFFNLNEEI